MENIERNATMQAWMQKSHDGPQDMALVDNYPRPTVSPRNYLIRVGAAGINFADVMQTHGTYAGGPHPPYVAGFEAAGHIIAIGDRVENPLPVGTRIIGTGPGAFAHYMQMPAAGVLPIPQGWSDPEALGMILNWATALAALQPLGRVRAGDTVLVHAAAGGVGQAAIRLAVHYGARVIAIASASKHAAVKALGAEVVLESPRSAELDDRKAAGSTPTKGDLFNNVMAATDGAGVDVVLESVGAATFHTSLAVTKPFTGRVIVFGAASGDASLATHDLVFTHQVQVQGFHIGALAQKAPIIYQSLLEELNILIDQGVYPPGTPHIHPMSEGKSALQSLASGHTQGKHALDPWQ